MTALALPDDFNPETHMLSKTRDTGVLHASREAAGFAGRLVANGAPQDLEVAKKVLDAVLGCQERREGDPHYGNFRWYLEDEVVEDLNAVEFVLEHFIPMMLRHGDRLPPDVQNRVREGIRLGLGEIRNLNVLVAYTNIAALDILNSCLGGELLEDPEIAGWGYRKLAEWMAFTDRFGIPFEYNSPTYTAVTIRALKHLTDLVRCEDTRIRARTMAARLGLSVGLHIHAGTGRWAGPHSRAYQPTVVCETEAESHMVDRWIEDGTLPAWTADVLQNRPEKLAVVETAYPQRELGITTYHSPSFALGVSANGGMGGQSNVLIAHYNREGAERPGVLYTRYLINDKWLGDFYHDTDRSKSRNLMEEGRFYGVQQGPRAIGLYTPGSLGRCASSKATLIWTRRDLVDEIWVGDARVTDLPADIPDGVLVVLGSGDALFAVRPLARTDLGRNAPVRLVDIQGDLVLELHNYLGPEKTFWEMDWPGAFFKGRPQCGFYVEVAERAEYPDGRAFGQTVSSGNLKEKTDAPFVYAMEGERLWQVEYGRDGKALGIEIDLMAWELKRRWTQDGDLGWPMLDSRVARETRTGSVTVGDATLRCGKDAAWLFASPGTKRWVAAYHGQTPAPLTLTVPDGKVEIDAMGVGTVVWDDGCITVEAVGLQGMSKVTGGRLAE